LVLLSNSRSYDWKALDKVVEKYKEAWIGFDPEALIGNEHNILVTDGEENYGLFEEHAPGVYYGHYMFTVRGPQTLNVARNLLGFFFKEYDARAVLGLTPVEHTGALSLNKKLGFTFHGIIDTEAGPHYQVSIKKEDFKYE
jgi:hypothetical protein